MTREFIDLPIVLSDAIVSVPTSASLSAEGSVAGSVAYVEDVKALYAFDGSAWKPTGGYLSSSAPVSAVSPGVAGTITWDSGFLYICVAANTWKRVAIATW